jgi:hypothetical protein
MAEREGIELVGNLALLWIFPLIGAVLAFVALAETYTAVIRTADWTRVRLGPLARIGGRFTGTVEFGPDVSLKGRVQARLICYAQHTKKQRGNASLETVNTALWTAEAPLDPVPGLGDSSFAEVDLDLAPAKGFAMHTTMGKGAELPRKTGAKGVKWLLEIRVDDYHVADFDVPVAAPHEGDALSATEPPDCSVGEAEEMSEFEVYDVSGEPVLLDPLGRAARMPAHVMADVGVETGRSEHHVRLTFANKQRRTSLGSSALAVGFLAVFGYLVADALVVSGRDPIMGVILLIMIGLVAVMFTVPPLIALLTRDLVEVDFSGIMVGRRVAGRSRGFAVRWEDVQGLDVVSSKARPPDHTVCVQLAPGARTRPLQEGGSSTLLRDRGIEGRLPHDYRGLTPAVPSLALAEWVRRTILPFAPDTVGQPED